MLSPTHDNNSHRTNFTTSHSAISFHFISSFPRRQILATLLFSPHSTYSQEPNSLNPLKPLQSNKSFLQQLFANRCSNECSSANRSVYFLYGNGTPALPSGATLHLAVCHTTCFLCISLRSSHSISFRFLRSIKCRCKKCFLSALMFG